MNAGSNPRLFVALSLPEPVRTALVHAAAPLRATPANLRWVRADILHLTLVFLGERPAGQVEAIARALDAVCREQPPFVLTVGRNGCFPSAERARVLWTGLTGDIAALIALQRALVTGLVSAELMQTNERFTPHLTIGRLRDDTAPAARADTGHQWMRLPPLPSAPIPVKAVHLMRSVLAPGGAHYSTLRSFALARGG